MQGWLNVRQMTWHGTEEAKGLIRKVGVDDWTHGGVGCGKRLNWVQWRGSAQNREGEEKIKHKEKMDSQDI